MVVVQTRGNAKWGQPELARTWVDKTGPTEPHPVKKNGSEIKIIGRRVPNETWVVLLAAKTEKAR